MDIRKGFGSALRRIRKQRNLTQEDFGIVSSRTYLSTLERGLKSPTIEKIVELSDTMDIHPLTLLTMAFAEAEDISPSILLDKIAKELLGLKRATG